ncbi:hypothetical protein [Aurantibacillus circumpalustris]|uniref:hypothetical protein n=1 Tax=Aurantibacillus circumpalustris TaxID=3036359 RepID=UPI00295AD648|nr:hypothetical protein [Aurantibacillus circumpalustris]
MRLFLLFVLFIQLFLLNSCKKYKEADPSFFLKSKTISVTTNPLQGTSSNKITDLWVYTDGKFQGVYPVGNLIPISSKENGTKINVFAGIKNNGISDTRIFYPFFNFLTIDTFVAAGKTIERDFTFNYKNVTTFTWTENFDSGSAISVKKELDAVFEIVSGAESFENKSLKVTLFPDSGIAGRLQSSSDGFFLPTGTGDVFLELNYKCNTPVTIGLTDDVQRMPAITLNPQEVWNKTYIQLSTIVTLLNTSKNKVYFEFYQNPSGNAQSYLFLDNLKLLYIKP